MIKELRIGNYLKAPLGELARVKQLGSLDYPDFIKYDLLNEKGEINGFGQNSFEPIPLTPEVLLAAGFQKFDNTWIIGRISEWEVHLMKYGFVITHETCDPRIWNIPINTLHGVQNAIFALTGTELEIDITKLKQ